MTGANYLKAIFPIQISENENSLELTPFKVVKGALVNSPKKSTLCPPQKNPIHLSRRGAKVIATDFTEAALKLTKEILDESQLSNCEFYLQDIQASPIPKVDIALCIGVMPYLNKFETVTKNIMPNAEKVLFNFLKSNNGFNLIRRNIDFLNVRDNTFFNSNTIKKQTEANNFIIIDEIKLGTGTMYNTQRK